LAEYVSVEEVEDEEIYLRSENRKGRAHLGDTVLDRRDDIEMDVGGVVYEYVY
jgi:hypothetical protein